jgi:hypothetical protein
MFSFGRNLITSGKSNPWNWTIVREAQTSRAIHIDI